MNAQSLPGRMALHVREDGDCLTWTGSIQTKGYGSTTDGFGRSTLAHRRAWIAANGPIPDGLTVDHLCMNKRCVNVDHMEVVTRSENSRRGRRAQMENTPPAYYIAQEHLIRGVLS